MAIEFQKMHGAGNDFALLDLRHNTYPLDRERVIDMADRRTGIGFDQLLTLHLPENRSSLARFEVWNADGSRAEQCGNGVRCIGLYLEMLGETGAQRFTLEGPVETVELESAGDSRFCVNMGKPSFGPTEIPLTLTPVDDLYPLNINDRTLMIGAVSMGNPHALLQVDDIREAPVADLGAAISSHPAFPQGCNAGFAEIVDRNSINLRVYERGAAETLACGSGACAAAVILIKAGKLGQEVLVNQNGGSIMVEWSAFDGPVMMTGPAVHVFTGMLS